MNARTAAATALLLLASLGAGTAMAKLPPPSDEAKAKAAEAAARTAYAGKVSAYQLCKTMDRIAAAYFAQAKASGQAVKPAEPSLPPCTEPGVFVYTPPAEPPPLEAAGAHSPPKTATAPPSSLTPAAEQPKKP